MVQETINDDDITALKLLPNHGRILSLDPGTKRVGVGVCDETQTLSRPIGIIERTSWKKLLASVASYLMEYDAVALVVGLPYNSDGTESEMSAEAREMVRKFRLSLTVPVLFQDERSTSYEARGRIWAAGGKDSARADSEAAAIILSDFLDRLSSARREPLST
jgi:putative holliday junction resolvase